MNKPKKLIRKNIVEKLKPGEWEEITDQKELNNLYALKVKEELAEIQDSEHKDIMEFVDLIQVAFSFAKRNGFTKEQISKAMIEKSIEKGSFGTIALNNLNPNNPSNKIYFNEIGVEFEEVTANE
jgi:predicted house-cleaning noncanonical NTP pyrophosphatase (MazG superfamily)